MNLTEIKKNIETHGFSSFVYDFYYQSINRFTFFKVLQAMSVTMDTLDPQFLIGDDKYTYKFLTESELREFSKDPKYQMSKNFLDLALAKKDFCFAVLDQGVLASFGWYSKKPTNINNDLILSFKDSYVYMYKGYTSEDYRGQRLHAIGMAKALEAFSKKGFEGLISYVECNNFSSLKSVYRMGYQNIGRLTVAKIPGKYFITRDEECRRYEFNLSMTMNLPQNMLEA